MEALAVRAGYEGNAKFDATVLGLCRRGAVEKSPGGFRLADGHLAGERNGKH
jgi:hypothetical protein